MRKDGINHYYYQCHCEGVGLCGFYLYYFAFFMDPYHPVIKALSQVIEPLLAPIRKHLPPIGGLDFSPLVLMIGLQLLGSALVAIAQLCVKA
jgi:uncharacterized protein YggT (Ycf19 family)